MNTLYIDTSLENVSIALIRDKKILSIIQNDIPNEHSVYATKYVKDVIDEAKIKTDDIDNIMVVNGPGSFTGVRIGVTIAKTYGYLINKEIYPVSSLKSLAISANKKDIVMSIIHANKSNYYVGLYDEKFKEIVEEKFASLDEVKEIIDKYHPYIVGNREEEILGNVVHKTLTDVILVTEYYFDKLKVSAHMINPNYLKLPQALESKKND